MYRYDVRVAVHREATMPSGQGRSGPVYEGTIKTVSDWKASWVAPVYLDRCAGMKLKVTAQPAGQFDRKFDWNDTTKQTGYTDKVNANDTTKLYDVPPCHYTYASHVPARLSVTAQFGDLSANPEHKSFDFLGGQDFSDQTASKADFEHAAEARRAACDLKREGIAFRYTSIGGTTMPLNGFNGMLIGDNQLHLTFEMPPNSPVDAPILDGLVAGKGFNYDTGEQLYQDGSGTSSRVRATVSFSPSGNPSDSGGPPPPPPPPPRVPKPDCDPQKYWDDYARKWNSSQQFFEQAQKDVKSASKELSDWEKEEGKVMVEIAAEKYDLLQAAQLALEEAATHLLHKLVGYFGLASTAAWIYTDVYPHVRTHEQEMENAAKEVDAAVALGNEAIADLKRQLSQNANCKDQWAKADAEAKAKEKLLDQAKQLRDEWQLEGSALYKDPNDPNGYPLDARAALQRAIDILSKSGAQQGSHSLNSSPSDRATLLNVNFLQSETGASFSDKGPVHMVSVEQLRAALQEVQAAESMMTNGKAMMENQKTFEKKWGQQLGTLTVP